MFVIVDVEIRLFLFVSYTYVCLLCVEMKQIGV